MLDALKTVLDMGMEVTNKQGGYMRKVENSEGEYLFQTCYRSSNYGEFKDMAQMFFEEIGLEITM